MKHNKSSKFSTSRGAVLGGLASLIAVVIIGLGILLFIFGYVVPPGMMGVRQITLGPGQGFSKKALSPGYHWTIPSYSTIHFVPETLQIVNLHREAAETRESRGRSGQDLPALEIQTADRASVLADVSVVARFHSEPGTIDGQPHGGPADLIQKIGPRRAMWEEQIRGVVDDQLKRALGKLATAEFYNPFKREEKVKEALRGANERLSEFAIKIEAILLRRFIYKDERIDSAIFRKNLQDQEERLNMMASRFAKAQADLEQVAAKLDAEIETLKVEGENKAKVVRSEADLYEQTKRAEADLLVNKAKAEADRLRAAALAKSAGSAILVAREMTPFLASLKGGLVSGLDPYDVNKWVKRLGVETQP